MTVEKNFDYKDPETLRKYLDGTGRIKPRCKTGLTPNEHRQMERAVKRARHLALLPFGRGDQD